MVGVEAVAVVRWPAALLEKPLRFSMCGEVVAIDVARWAGRAGVAPLTFALAGGLLALWLLLALLLTAEGLGLGRDGSESERGKQGGATGAEQGTGSWAGTSMMRLTGFDQLIYERLQYVTT